MASLPFPGQWSSDVQLTGNSDCVIDQNNVLWLVSDSTATGAALYSSTNFGITFTLVVAIPNVENVGGIVFDPAVTLDSFGNVHFIGQVMTENSGVEIWKYTWNVTTNTLAGPFTVATEGLVASDYDIIGLADGNTYVAVCLLTASEEMFVGFEVNSNDGSIVSTDDLVEQAFPVGSRFGSVSLYSPDGISVEIYVNSHPKIVTFQNFTLTVSVIVRTGLAIGYGGGGYGSGEYGDQATVPGYGRQAYGHNYGSEPQVEGYGDGGYGNDGGYGDAAGVTVAAPVTLFTIPVRHTDNRLTVLGSGTARYLSQCYYTQQGAVITGNILLGYTPNGETWNFSSLPGTATASVVQPTLSLSADGLVLGMLTKNLTQGYGDGPISIQTVTPSTWTFTPRLDFPYGASATFLRGTKSYLPSQMPWGMLAETAAGVATYYTGYNAPPVVSLSPNAIANAVLGTTYQFNASGSFSYNLDLLQFSWSLNDPTDLAVFTPSGETATLMLPLSAGPATKELIVTVSVVATDSKGNVLHTAVTQSANVGYGAVNPPVIDSAGAQNVARNTTVTFTPTIVYGSGALTYAWAQTSGTTMAMESLPTTKTLMFETNGALVAGEAIVWQLTVSDGINSPVIGYFTFDVAARTASYTETAILNRVTWSGTLSQRNGAMTWGVASATSLVTEFTTAKRGALIGGGYVYILISSYSILVQAALPESGSPTAYSVLLPNAADTILDAIHSDLNQTVVLTGAGLLQQFFPTTASATDDSAATITLSAIVSGSTFTTLQATPNFAGVRVFTLAGPNGVLMLEININDFAVVGVLQLTQASGLLYGANNVTYVRTADVESLRTGQVLVGTEDSSGSPYETLVDLATRSIVETFDETHLQSQTITTGETLFAKDDSYSGSPQAPILFPVTSGVDGVTLTWSQTRTDLISGYYIQVSAGYFYNPDADYGGGDYGGGLYGGGQDGYNSSFITVATVLSGQSLAYVVANLTPGQSYGFAVQAFSLDGPSPVSNIQTISL